MVTFLKKRFSAFYGMRVVIALLYVYVNFTVLQNHTCYSINEDLYGCHLEDSNYQFAKATCSGTHLEIKLNQNNYNSTVLSNVESCTACLYSLISQLFKLNQTTPQALGEYVVKVRFIYHLNFTKLFEWLSSASLRAPPIVTS